MLSGERRRRAYMDREGGPVALLTQIETSCVRAAVMSETTAARIVRAYDRYRILVNSDIPRGSHAAVARHLVESHDEVCSATHCERAQRWLPSPVEAASAG